VRLLIGNLYPRDRREECFEPALARNEATSVPFGWGRGRRRILDERYAAVECPQTVGPWAGRYRLAGPILDACMKFGAEVARARLPAERDCEGERQQRDREVLLGNGQRAPSCPPANFIAGRAQIACTSPKKSLGGSSRPTHRWAVLAGRA
jgi:hypothetical protein